MRTVGVVTTSRADYGIYRPLLQCLEADDNIELRLFVSGMHLSQSLGLTVKEIEADGFAIQERIHTLMASDEPSAVAKSMGVAVMGYSSAFQRWQPDILVTLGDRFEMHPAAAAALPFQLPVAHIHGGELTYGAIDDALRHSMTKLSHLHFASTEEYAARIRQMGEEAWRVHVCGAPSLDNLSQIDLMDDKEFEEAFGFALPDNFLLVTYHPVTLAHENTRWQVRQLLEALDSMEMPVVFTKSNADTKGQLINQVLEEYVGARDRAFLVDHLGTRGYFTAMSRASAMVGNSSSGLLEAPSFQLPVVNIGERQDGRVRGPNVVDVEHDKQAIEEGLHRAISEDFRDSLADATNPYGDGNAAAKIRDALVNAPEREELLRKKFIDL